MRTTTKYDRNEAGPVKLGAARAEFDAEVTYLNTATFGLPPRRSWLALQHALAGWRAGTADPVAYDARLAAAWSSYARLVGVDPSAVAVGSQVSVFAGLIAANLPDGSEVLTATGDFTSILFPFLAQSGRGVQVREVPQAVGWLPVDAARFAYTACGGYKWLLSPRGTAYFTIRPELMDELVPHTAGWYAGESPWSSIYGRPLRLAADAAASTSPRPGTPGSRPLRLWGCSLTWGRSPCTGMPWAWPTGSASGSAWSQETPRSYPWPSTRPPQTP
jgi:selenocysteine lyase/cysteine desulfurase